jgi:hypothetical protein
VALNELNSSKLESLSIETKFLIEELSSMLSNCVLSKAVSYHEFRSWDDLSLTFNVIILLR